MEHLYTTDNANALVNKLNANFEGIKSDDLTVQKVFLGTFTQVGDWVKQKNIVCPVADGITYTCVLPSNIVAKISYGYSSHPSVDSPNLFNGNTFTFPAGANTQSIYFAKYISGSVTMLNVEEVNELINKGEIAITYLDLDVITHNSDKDNLVATAKRVVKNNSQVYVDTLNIAPIIAHISDLHGDIQRAYNYFKYCKWKGVDDCVVSGDSTLYSGEGIDYVFEAAKANNIHITLAMGNHEAQGITSSAGVMFNTYLANYAEELNYYKTDNTVTDRGYYYYDVQQKSLRIIVIDQFDGGVYGSQGNQGRISQGQIDFLIAALLNVPNGYGVVIVLHSQEDSITMPQAFSKFISSTPNSYAASGLYVDQSRPIKQIVDAFIGRTTYSSSYTQTYGGATETVNVSADFSEVDSSVDFICYLAGHRHRDFIGYLSGTTHPQLIILATCGNAHTVARNSSYAFSEDDLPRYGVGVTQDAFNLYAIDRDAKTVRIVRIGSSMNYEFRERDYLVASYATIPNS